MEHLRVISIQDVSGTSLLFLANNFREAELLMCGLKLLLERETARLGVRGGLTAFGGRYLEGAMSPAAARGFRDAPAPTSLQPKTKRRSSRRRSSFQEEYDSTDVGEDSVSENHDESELDERGRRKWGNVPGRDYMRGQAATLIETEDHVLNEQGVPHYAHGYQIVRELAKNIRLPLPLPLCRVLLLDSSSPVIKAWERDRGDSHLEKTRWAFPPATPRELERHTSEHQLIASGSMCGAHRTSSFERPRYGTMVHLSETHTVDADDSKKVAFTVTERSPRRGFSVRVRILLRAYSENACDATVFAEVRPVGKDMSNQAAVHKAFLLVLDEVKLRYGAEGHGLLAGFLSVVDDMASSGSSMRTKQENGKRSPLSRPFRRTDPTMEEKKSDISPRASAKANSTNPRTSGLVSFEDMLKTGRESPETTPVVRPSTPNIQHQVPGSDPGKRLSANGPSIREADLPPSHEKKEPALMIEVKPLPKIRLSLMPSPREEDEEESSDTQPIPTKSVRKKKPSRSRHFSPGKASRSNML
jgi:hypothetical protein